MGVERLEHNGETIAGALISRRDSGTSPTEEREFFAFAFHREGNNLNLVGAGRVGDFTVANLHVFTDGAVQAEGLDEEGNIERELVFNANFFRIRV